MKKSIVRIVCTVALAASFLFYGEISSVFSAIADDASGSLLKNGDFNSVTETMFGIITEVSNWKLNLDNVDVEGEDGNYNLKTSKENETISQKIENLDEGYYEFSVDIKTEGAVEIKLSAMAENAEIACKTYHVSNCEWQRYSIGLTNTEQQDVTFKIEITENAEQKAVRIDNAGVILANIKTENGAEIRIDETSAGLRFMARVEKSYYDNMTTKYGDANVSVGMMIAPANYITSEYTYEILKEQGKEPLMIIANKQNNDADVDGYYGYSFAITDILLQNTDRKFSARAFLRYKDEGNEKYEYAVYDEDNHSRSMYEVAEKAKADNPTEYEYKILQNYINKVRNETLGDFENKDGNAWETTYNCTDKGLLIISDKEKLEEGSVKIFAGETELSPTIDDGRNIYIISNANTTITIRYTLNTYSALYIMDSLQIKYYVKSE